MNDLYGGDGITLVSDPRNAPSGINPGFVNSSIEGLEGLSSQLLSTLSPFSLSSGPPGFTFDFELGVPIQEKRSLGPLIAERAETIGKKRLNIAFSYTRLDFKRLDGDKLSGLKLFLESDDIIPPGGDGIIGPDPPCDPADPLGCTSIAAVELDQIQIDLDVEIERDIFALFAKFGVLDNLGRRSHRPLCSRSCTRGRRSDHPAQPVQ